jgi:hypothetical protein
LSLAMLGRFSAPSDVKFFFFKIPSTFFPLIKSGRPRCRLPSGDQTIIR